MNIDLVVYHPDGEIIKTMRIPEDWIEFNVAADEKHILVDSLPDPLTHWVSGDKVMEKIDFPAVVTTVIAQAEDYRIHISEIPHDTTVLWPDGESTLENDRNLDCIVTMPGEYRFWLQAPRYLKKEVVLYVQ